MKKVKAKVLKYMISERRRAKTMYEKYTLKELLEDYLNFINVAVPYTQRDEIHREIMKRLGLEYEEYNKEDTLKINYILHHLDEEIGFIIGVEYDEKEIEKMAKTLERKLIALQKEVSQDKNNH